MKSDKKKVGFFKNLKDSIDDKSSMSVNSIAVLASAVIGSLVGLVVCFVLVYDVISNGFVKTNLFDLGLFLMSSGAYILGSGMPKAIVDSRLKSRPWAEGEMLDEEMGRHRRFRTRSAFAGDEEMPADEEYDENNEEITE
jgi:hypothetical protein